MLRVNLATKIRADFVISGFSSLESLPASATLAGLTDLRSLDLDFRLLDGSDLGFGLVALGLLLFDERLDDELELDERELLPDDVPELDDLDRELLKIFVNFLRLNF